MHVSQAVCHRVCHVALCALLPAEFMQWFKMYFDQQTSGQPITDYDGAGRRAISKSGGEAAARHVCIWAVQCMHADRATICGP